MVTPIIQSRRIEGEKGKVVSDSCNKFSPINKLALHRTVSERLLSPAYCLTTPDTALRGKASKASPSLSRSSFLLSHSEMLSKSHIFIAKNGSYTSILEIFRNYIVES